MSAGKINGKFVLIAICVRDVELDSGYPESKLGSMQTILVTQSSYFLLH